MVFLILCPDPFISNVIQTTLTVCIDGKYLLVSIDAPTPRLVLSADVGVFGRTLRHGTL